MPFLSHSEPRISFVAVENSSYGKRITAFSCAVLKAKEFSKNVSSDIFMKFLIKENSGE